MGAWGSGFGVIYEDDEDCDYGHTGASVWYGMAIHGSAVVRAGGISANW